MESEFRGNGKKTPVYAAAVDLGSNSFRLLIAEFDDRSTKTIINRLETVALGRHLTPGKPLSNEARGRAEEVLRSFCEQLQQFSPRYIRACGTEALRQAGDSDVFLASAGKILNCKIEILSGEQEARLAFTGVSAALGHLQPPLLMVDAGGGSTELVALGNAAEAPSVRSVPIGALSLTDRFTGTEKADPAALLLLRQHLYVTLSPLLDNLVQKNSLCLIGSGGTATALAALALSLQEYDPLKVHGYRMSVERMEEVYSFVLGLSAAERNRLPGLEKGRGRIIIAGIEIFRAITALTKADYLTVSDTGLLEGILLSALPSNGTLGRL